MSKIIYVGLGHKARQGKDFMAKYISKNYPFTVITHWAEALYTECRNKDRKFALINRDDGFHLLRYTSTIDGMPLGNYHSFTEEEMPTLKRIFDEREIDFYPGMDEKDSEILQVWGTNFRRTHYGEDYWIQRTAKIIEEKVKNITTVNNMPILVLIPDTRFINELEWVKNNNGIYIDVQRTSDGEAYIDPERDPNHPSETSLDNAVNSGVPDYIISAESGDINMLQSAAKNIVTDLVFKGGK